MSDAQKISIEARVMYWVLGPVNTTFFGLAKTWAYIGFLGPMSKGFQSLPSLNGLIGRNAN
jgi:hypothetical protein